MLRTHRGLVNNGLATGDWINMTEQDRMWEHGFDEVGLDLGRGHPVPVCRSRPG